MSKNRESQGVRREGENALIDLRSHDSRLTALIPAFMKLPEERWGNTGV